MRPAFRIVLLITSLAVAPLAAQPSPSAVIVSGAAANRADAALSRLEHDGMSGVFLVALDGQVVLRKGYGLANRASHLPFTPDVVTQIGSNTKDFTAVAILQLAGHGRLSVDDKLSKFFPAAPADKRDITLAQLLEHTAGMEEYAGGDFDPVTREQFVRHMLASPLRSKPGAEMHYSNPGYGLLAVVIEMVSGQTYDEYVRDHILAPLGLTHTGYLLPKFDMAHVSHGYDGDRDRGTILERPHAADGPYWNLRGNGGMVSTVDDMYRFYEALFGSERLIAFRDRHGMFSPTQPIGLAGSDGTHFFLYERDPQRHAAYIIATNNAAFQGPRVRRPLESALFTEAGVGAGEGPAVTAGAGALPSTPAGAAFAKYMAAFNSGDTVKVASMLGELFAPNPQSPPMAQRIATYRRMFGSIGAMVPRRVESLDDTTLVVHVRNKAGDDVAIRLTVEPGAAHRIVSIGVTIE